MYAHVCVYWEVTFIIICLSDCSLLVRSFQRQKLHTEPQKRFGGSVTSLESAHLKIQDTAIATQTASVVSVCYFIKHLCEWLLGSQLQRRILLGPVASLY